MSVWMCWISMVLAEIPPPTCETIPCGAARVAGTTHYADVLNHCRRWPPYEPFDWGQTRQLISHEATHGINSWEGGLYLGEGCLLRLQDPQLSIQQIDPYIPDQMRRHDRYTYDLYVTSHWNQTSLDIFEEWICYINDGRVAIELGNQGSDRDCGVRQCVSFSIYGTAVAMAVKAQRPDYWESEPNFRRFVHWSLRWSRWCYQESQKYPVYRSEQQEATVQWLLQSPEAAGMRQFLEQELDGVWVR